MDIEKVVKHIINASFKIHKEFGPGLLESVYEALLFDELNAAGLDIERQVAIPIIWKNRHIGKAFIADLIVNDLVIVELKSCEKLERVHYKQLLTYLKISDLEIGLLINFNEALLKNGIRRIMN